MFNLSFHGNEEEDDEVEEEDRPEDWHIKHLEEGHEEGDYHRSNR